MRYVVYDLNWNVVDKVEEPIFNNIEMKYT